MAVNNTIQLREDFVSILDEVYKEGSKSSVLDSATGLERLPSGEFQVPVITLDGLADHSRANGGQYVDGDTNLEYKSYEPTYDRNRKFTVDVRDDIETGDVAFGRLAGAFIREKVTPEVDAVRFAAYAQKAGNKAYGTINAASTFITAIEAATNTLDDAEVPEEGRILFATPALINSLLALDTYKSKELIANFSQVIKVPKSRFYEFIKLNDGKTSGQTAGGYVQTDDGNTHGKQSRNINFLIVHPSAVIQDIRHEAPKHIPAAANQNADGDSFAYRIAGVEEVFFNKTAGIYAHLTGTTPATE